MVLTVHKQREAYVAEVRNALIAVKPLPHGFLDSLLALLRRLYPWHLPDSPSEAVVSSFHDWILALTTAPKAIEKLRETRHVLGTSEALLEAIEAAAHDSARQPLKARVLDELGLSGKQANWGLAFHKSVDKLLQLAGTTDVSVCGDVPLQAAERFCWELLSPALLPKVRLALLRCTGFRHCAELQSAWPRLESIAAEYKLATITGGSGGKMRGGCFDAYLQLAALLGDTPRSACANLPAADLARMLDGAEDQSRRQFVKLVSSELRFLQRLDALKELHRLTPPPYTCMSLFDWLCARSSWHERTLTGMLEATLEHHSRTSFQAATRQRWKYLLGMYLAFLRAYAESSCAAGIQLAPNDEEREPLRWFIEHCTRDSVVAAAKALLESRQAKNEFVKTTRPIHHAAGCASHLVSFLKVGFSAALGRDIGLDTLTAKILLRGVANLRAEASGEARRTYTDEEISKMFDVCDGDHRWSLMLRLLREIGLRVSALCHLKYGMLIDETHTPRHVCRVPEKGRTWRSFVTSLPLKQAIKRYAEDLRDAAPANKDMYLLNPTRPERPVNPEVVRKGLQRIAQAAGVTEVVVHPHAFRHTIVGQLVEAGNPMELVSKYMGHAHVSTTAANYWVPIALEVHDKMNNPFTGTFQRKADAAEEAQEELELVYEKLDAAVKLFHQLHGVVKVVSDSGGSAAEVQARFAAQVPNATEILRGVLDSTSASMTAAQSVVLPRDEQSGLAAVEEASSQEGASDEENDSAASDELPALKRQRTATQH